MRNRRPYLRHKLRIYFDENVPPEVITHFSSHYWADRLKTANAIEAGHAKMSDKFHYNYCIEHGYTLATLDTDFNNDRAYPFLQGKMCGIIVISSGSDNPARIVDILPRLLRFLIRLPLPRAFLMETKIIAGRDGVLFRGRHIETKNIVSFKAIAGRTTIREIREAFGY